MKISLDFPWERYGVILELAGRCKARERILGKTALQKFVYLLQELHGVPVGYDFTLYTYGPYSAQLMQELDVTAAMDGVDVSYDSNKNAYSVLPGSRYQQIRDRADQFIAQATQALDAVMSDFGDYSARELELLATIVYVSRNGGPSAPGESDALVAAVRDLKPHFTSEEICNEIETLRGKGYVHVP